MQHEIQISPLGDSALVVRRREGSSKDWTIMANWASLLRESGQAWMVDIVPAYDTVTVIYQPNLAVKRPYHWAADQVRAVLLAGASTEHHTTGLHEQREIVIPVCYGGDYGPDLEAAAYRSGKSAADFIAAHSAGLYTVVMIGFMPGFPYLSGLSPELAQPRLEVPRSYVPAGSVGIGGGQTGVYPLAAPGGWQLIGRTPVCLFSPMRLEPALLRAGDRVKFLPITEAEFMSWEAEQQ